MPRCGRRGSGKLTPDHKHADITLDDCANSRICTRRLRKFTSNSLLREVKELSVAEDYLEKTVDDLDETLDISKQSETAKGKGTKSKTGSSTLGMEYPLDLWFILADYVRPEDVQVFAAICKSSSFVVSTFQFWIGLYKRYYSSNAHLPEHLHPNLIRKTSCFRVCVIRALYHIYPPFAKRTTRASLDEEVYNLVPLKCVSVWHTNSNDKWSFFFKFQSNGSATHQKPTKPSLRTPCDTWSDSADYDVSPVRDVNANPEDGCRVLFVSCLHYTSVMPSIMGAHLADIKIAMKDAHHHVVQLSFATNSYQCSPRRKNSCVKGSGDVVLLDCVESSQVYHWWHPKYPFNCF